MRTFHTFKNTGTFQKFLRTKYQNCHQGKYGNIGCLDYVKVGGVLYTMHEFDLDGRTVTWANKKHEKMLEMTTFNRYHDGYADAVVEAYPAYYLRTDINYAE